MAEPDTRPVPAPRLLSGAVRLLRRDLTSGRLLIMLLAAIIAVGSTVSVNLLVSRVQRVMMAESSALLAADMALDTSNPAAARYLDAAARLGLTLAHTVTTRSVVAFGAQLQLVQLKAVDANYPLRGELSVATAPLAAGTNVGHGPTRGEVWGDARLFQLLDLKVGDTLAIGRGEFVVSRVLQFEPDRGGDLFSIAPRLMMHLDDLAATGLIVAGSRASYRTLLAGPARALDRYRAEINLNAGDSLLDPRTARPEMRSAFVQAERFLTLAAFAGVFLATIGIALAASAYAEHHATTVAIMKTLGLTRREVMLILGIEIALLALIATAIGDLLAWTVHTLLASSFVPEADLGHSYVPLRALTHGAWVALVILGGFALPTLARVSTLPVTHILNRDRAALPSSSYWPYAMMLLASVLIAPWYLGNARLVVTALAGMLGSALLLALAAFLLVRLLGRLRARTAMSWRFGLANIARRARLSVLQATAIGLGIAVVLLLGLVRDDLFKTWRDRLPPGAPNHFLINIQADEVDTMREFLAARGHAVAFFPMVRGRLNSINGVPVDLERYDNPRARRLADREFNLSWATTMKADNRLVGGHWPDGGGMDEMSVEIGIAELLGIALGDHLRFGVADRSIEGRVTSLREVDWDNFEVNFFVVTSPALLAEQPATYITSFYLAASDAALMPQLVRRFPSVTVIDVDALMQQVRQVMDRVAGALTWVFGFALLAGALVLAAAVQATQRERILDVVLLKTLGAPRRFITLTTLVEFALLGLLCGLLGSAGALGTAWLVAHFVLEIPYAPGWQIPFAGVSSGIIGVTAIGALVVRHTHRLSVVASLRSTS